MVKMEKVRQVSGVMVKKGVHSTTDAMVSMLKVVWIIVKMEVELRRTLLEADIEKTKDEDNVMENKVAQVVTGYMQI